MKNLSNAQKTRLLIIIVVMLIVFYAIGVATDLFANEAFRMFFILSREDAHTFSIFLLAGAGSGALLSLAILVSKRRGMIFSKKRNEPQEPIIASTNSPVNSTDSGRTQDESEPYSIKESPKIEPFQKAFAIPNVDSKTSGLICPYCKKRFTTPLYMADYSTEEAKVMPYCPYCDAEVDSLIIAPMIATNMKS